MFTIGRLAATAGVTVRTVRHYHQIGLLPEPERDASGYRRYGAQAAVDLVRIRTLADAGVPLSRIEELLRAQPAEFAAAVDDIDAALSAKIDQLAEHRRRIAELAGGEALVLPPEVVATLNRLRDRAVSERTIRLERDWVILTQATDPDAARQWTREKAATLADAEKLRLYLACDRAADWDPQDPRVNRLIDDLEAREVAHEGGGSRPAGPTAVFSLILTESPVWRRIVDTLAHRAERRRTAL